MKRKREQSGKVKVYTNRLYIRMICLYAVVLLFMGGIACRFAYINRRNEIINSLEDVMADLNQEYMNCTRNFWRVYMPVFENRDSVYYVLQRYFAHEDTSQLTPFEKRDVTSALQKIMNNDGRIQWIGLYLNKEMTNYLLFEGDSGLSVMPSDFPFIEDMENKGAAMEVYGSYEITHKNRNQRYFALCGGSTMYMNNGKIIIGYATNDIAALYSEVEELKEVRYFITNSFGTIYDSAGEYASDGTGAINGKSAGAEVGIKAGTEVGIEAGMKNGMEGETGSKAENGTGSGAQAVQNGIIRLADGSLSAVRVLDKTGKTYTVYCIFPWKELFLKSNAQTPLIMAIVLVFAVCSILLYLWTRQVIIRKVDRIQTGLKKIGENELDYRIPIQEDQLDEFENISQSVNEVAACLQENIHKAYESKMRQKEAELSELQAKFDPHFLYNTLEVIRGKVYENGDTETADIIIKLAQIFRGFIESSQFVTIQEEMDFCSRYLALLRYRYDNRIAVSYDVDSSILQYGIIRNLLQPILENYFVHGFSGQDRKNLLEISAREAQNEQIRFCIKDNGSGMSKERLEELRESLRQAAFKKEAGYGLKGVQRRIVLFYGADCGLTVSNNEEGGVCVEVKISRLTCEEHYERLYHRER